VSATDDPGAALQLVHELRRLTVELDRFGAAFASRNGLHATDLRALIALLDADRAGIAATPGWLGGQLGLGSAATTALLDRLERAGHIGRTPDPGDRRRVLLRVQEQAKYLGWSFFGPLIGRMIASIGEFDEAELDAVTRFLGAMNEAVGSAAGGTDGGR